MRRYRTPQHHLTHPVARCFRLFFLGKPVQRTEQVPKQSLTAFLLLWIQCSLTSSSIESVVCQSDGLMRNVNRDTDFCGGSSPEGPSGFGALVVRFGSWGRRLLSPSLEVSTILICRSGCTKGLPWPEPEGGFTSTSIDAIFVLFPSSV
jgi:hypothetical protein